MTTTSTNDNSTDDVFGTSTFFDNSFMQQTVMNRTWSTLVDPGLNASALNLTEDYPNGSFEWSFDPDYYPSGYNTIQIIVMAIFATALMVVIVVGNMLVIVAISTEKHLKTVQNWFIASLAVSDFLVGLVVMPFSLAYELMGYWIFGEMWCDIHAAVDVLLCTASILNICMISLDRYWSITQAVEYLRKRTPGRAATMIVCVWILSGLISLPPLLGWKKPEQPKDIPKCEVSQELGYVFYSALGSFFIPSVIMVFVYFRIYLAARSRARRVVKRKVNGAKDKSTTTTSFSNTSPPDKNKNINSTNKPVATITVPCSSSPSTPREIPSQPSMLGVPGSNSSNEVEVIQPLLVKQNGSTTLTPQPSPYEMVKKRHASSHHHHQNVGGPSSDGEYCSEMEHSSDSDHQKETKSFVPLRKLNKLCNPYSKKSSKNRREEIDIGKMPKVVDPEKEKRRMARKKERRATVILGLIMASFILCWLPFFTMYVISPMCDGCSPPELYFDIAFWLGYCNSALNPVIYTIFNKDFRRAFRKILFK